jgi:hypothetical protein
LAVRVENRRAFTAVIAAGEILIRSIFDPGQYNIPEER